jgi:hypothetical protein
MTDPRKGNEQIPIAIYFEQIQGQISNKGRKKSSEEGKKLTSAAARC